MPRYWTLAEARSALPGVQELLRELQAALERAAFEADAGAPPAGPAVVPHVPSVNGHRRPQPVRSAQEEARRLLGRFEELGVQLKDVRTGLLDFPYLRNGEEVLLCYRQGEPDILFWHNLETGFAGRRPVEEL